MCFFRSVILFVSITDDVPSASSRNETEGHGRIFVERQRESRRSERLGRRAILLARRRGKQKNLATLSSLPSPPALQSVCNKGRVIGTGSLLGEIR